jgi:aminoglycoside 2'-N-acetyltransferase I
MEADAQTDTQAERFHLQIEHTSAVSREVLAASRDLLDLVFDGEMTDDDWDHSLGGMHAIAWKGDVLVGHSSVVQRRLVHDGATLRAGYVEGVGVHPAWQRQGVGAQMMVALEQIITAAYDLGALGATDEAMHLYEQRGWCKWLGPASALTPTGIVRTTDEEGYIYVLPGSHPLDLRGELTCDWRDGDVW